MYDYSAPKKMTRMGELFEKYRLHIQAPQSTVEKACAKAIKEVTGLEVRPEQISYTVSTRTLSLQVPSVLKSELRFHQEEILRVLEAELGRKGEQRTIL